jgi:hypothetical protein
VSSAPYAPTHRVPAAGLQAWDSPDATLPAAANLAANLDVQLLRWWGEWAEIRCSNGWTAWVGGRQLVPMAGAAPGVTMASVQDRLKSVPLPAGVSPIAAIGAALIVLGSFLPWASASAFGASINFDAWDTPFFFLVTGENTLSGFDIGLVLLVVAVGVIVVPVVTKQPIDPILLLVAAGVTVATVVMYFLRIAVIDDADGLSVGFGMFVSLAGGVMLGVAFQQAQRGVGAGGSE